MPEPAVFDAHPLLASAPVVIALFGNLQILINGKPVDTLRLNKSRALLAYLLVEGTKRHLRTDLAALLWPGYTAVSARVSLRQTLADLRNQLEPFDLLHTTHHHVALRAAPTILWCDVQQVQRLLASWHQHAQHRPSDCAHCRTHVQQAVALIKGGFLAHLPPTDSPPFDAWLQAQRRHWAEQQAAAQAALTATPHHVGNLRPALTTLIGRTTELAELAEKVAHPTYRCLSLVGPGGIGKTRLALALGEQQKAHFPDGVWLVELTAPAIGDVQANLAEEAVAQCQDHIATTIGATLGIAFQGANRPSAQVAAYLRDKTALLLLDNFEQMIAGTELLLQLLAAAPCLRLIVSSRQRLPLQAQLVYLVEGLPTPPDAAEQTARPTHLLTDYASVQLFLDRAQNAGFGLTLDASTLTAISALCRLVAGSPWAIELAVGLLDHYPPTALWQAIQTDYRALTGPWLDLPPRLRSAEAVLRTMWGALTPHEATCLARCAVFRGGFTRAAAQAIGDMTTIDLQALQHKSLLHPTGADRFTLHELVRQFAAEQLAQTPAAQYTVWARHAAYYIDLVQAQETALLRDWTAQDVVQRELNNLNAAWVWSAAHGEIALLAKGAGSLFTFYRLTGLYHEAIQRLASALAGVRQQCTATPADPAPARLLARLLCYAVDFYRRTGELATSTRLAQEALTLAQQWADPALQAAALHELARLAQVRGDFLTMQTLAEQGCTQARLTTNAQVLAECLNAVGWALSSQQQPLAASAAFEAALAALTGVTNHHLEGRICANLGRSSLAIRAYVVAQRHFEQALALQQQLRDQEEILLTRFMLGELWTAVGDYAAAQQAFAQVGELSQLTTNPYWLCWLHLCYGHWQQRCGNFTGAQMTLTLACQLARQSENRVFEHTGLLELGSLFIAQEEWAAAQHCYEQSLALQTGGAPSADTQAGLALCALATHQPTLAVAYVARALALLAQAGSRATNDLFQCYWFCLRVLQATADPRALDLVRTAAQLLQQDAAQFTTDAQRRSFLEKVAANRALMAAADEAGLK